MILKCKFRRMRIYKIECGGTYCFCVVLQKASDEKLFRTCGFSGAIVRRYAVALSRSDQWLRRCGACYSGLSGAGCSSSSSGGCASRSIGRPVRTGVMPAMPASAQASAIASFISSMVTTLPLVLSFRIPRRSVQVVCFSLMVSPCLARSSDDSCIPARLVVMPRYSFPLSEAHMIQQCPFHCPVAAASVTLYRQTLIVSGIGSSAAVKQHEHDCSRAGTCTYRYTEACRVQQLNR